MCILTESIIFFYFEFVLKLIPLYHILLGVALTVEKFIIYENVYEISFY